MIIKLNLPTQYILARLPQPKATELGKNSLSHLWQLWQLESVQKKICKCKQKTCFFHTRNLWFFSFMFFISFFSIVFFIFEVILFIYFELFFPVWRLKLVFCCVLITQRHHPSVWTGHFWSFCHSLLGFFSVRHICWHNKIKNGANSMIAFSVRSSLYSARVETQLSVTEGSEREWEAETKGGRERERGKERRRRRKKESR